MSDLVNPNDLVTTTDDSAGPKIRLLVCHTCKSMTPIPDYQGPADHDEMLQARVAEHQYPGSNPTRGHHMDLGKISEASWDNKSLRAQIVAEIQKQTVGSGQGEGLGELYDVKNNFAEDAMRCWRFEHGRTSNCDDYMSSGKLILADSEAERRDLGLDPKARASISLCQFCPYHSVVMQRKRKARGLYN